MQIICIYQEQASVVVEKVGEYQSYCCGFFETYLRNFSQPKAITGENAVSHPEATAGTSTAVFVTAQRAHIRIASYFLRILKSGNKAVLYT